MNNPVLILEGPDGSGKTTFAKWLVENHGFEYHHEGLPPANCKRTEYYGTLLWNAMNAKKPVVYDRFHLGELVYGPVKRDELYLGMYGMKLFLRITQCHPVHFLICLPGYETCHKNWKASFEAGNDYIQEEALFKDIYWRFKGLTAYHDEFSYVTESYDSAFYRALHDKPTFHAGYAGQPEPRFLVVGNRPDNETMDFPFFSRSPQSLYLNQVLWQAGYKENEMLFTTVYGINGQERELEDHFLAASTVALALSDVAEDWCKAHSLNYYALPDLGTYPVGSVEKLKKIREDNQ